MTTPTQSPPTTARASDNVSGKENGSNAISIAPAENKALRYVQAYMKIRQHYKELLAEDLIEDSALMMIFELYLSHVEKYDLTVTGLCAATDVPSTTALRRIDVICNLGIAAKRKDPHDSRRVLITLTAQGLEMVTRFSKMLAPYLRDPLDSDPRSN